MVNLVCVNEVIDIKNKSLLLFYTLWFFFNSVHLLELLCISKPCYITAEYQSKLQEQSAIPSVFKICSASSEPKIPHRNLQPTFWTFWGSKERNNWTKFSRVKCVAENIF